MAIKTYKKGTPIQLTTNFKSTEFDCHGNGCCATTLIDEQLVQNLQKIRNHFNKPVSISSGYRCASHNKSIGGATNSRHSKGQAADISIKGIAPAEIAKYAESIGILGIGLYETDKDGYFVHIDTRTTKAFWYGQKEEKRVTFGGSIVTDSPKEEVSTTTTELYRVRKDWKDAKSQIGAYAKLENAKIACDKTGNDYFVFDSKGVVVYPEKTDRINISKVKDEAADPKAIWDFLKQQGLNDFGVAGLMGNLYAESGLKPTNLQNTYEKSLKYSDAEYTAAVDQGLYTNFVNDKAGYGLAQWTYPTRKQNMLTFHKKKEKSIGDLITQLEFLMHELETSYKTSVLNVLKNATSLLEASNAVLLKFERPADQSTTVQTKRAAYGQSYYDKYHVKQIEVSPVLPTPTYSNKMKYSNKNLPMVCMQTQSTCYKGTNTMTIKGVLWHSTGANNPNLKRYIQPSDNAADRNEWLNKLGTNTYKNDWNHIDRQAGLNCWIGKLADGTVTTVQTMPWNYRPWGCGSGSKGSCNNGWIQFEICEDGLNDKNYFEQVYREACEITAYLCKTYNINPHGTVTMNGVKVPTILDHKESYKLGLGSNHGDVQHWFSKYGKTLADIRKDVATLMDMPEEKEEAVEVVTEIYRVRTSWEDAKSQYGPAYSVLDEAIKACAKAGNGYEVYNKQGVAIFPPRETISTPVSNFKIGDAVKLVSGSTYSSGGTIPSWLFRTKLYVRQIKGDGDIVISTKLSGAVTGVVAASSIIPYNATEPANSSFAPYLAIVTADVLNVRAGAGTQYKITTQIEARGIYTIVDEKDGWGKLKSGAGWVSLKYMEKI